MKLIRGTTPTIQLNIKSEDDLTMVTQVWIYFTQNKKIKIDKKIEDVTIDAEHNAITLILSQDDTLALKANTDTLFQMRVLLSNDTALANIAMNVTVAEVYKEGVITDGE